MADRMQFRRDTAANWTAYNPILLEGELGFELDTDQYKLGDGIHNWNALPYRGLPCVQQRGDSELTPMSQKAVSEEFKAIECKITTFVHLEADLSNDLTKYDIYTFKPNSVYRIRPSYDVFPSQSSNQWGIAIVPYLNGSILGAYQRIFGGINYIGKKAGNLYFFTPPSFDYIRLGLRGIPQYSVEIEEVTEDNSQFIIDHESGVEYPIIIPAKKGDIFDISIKSDFVGNIDNSNCIYYGYHADNSYTTIYALNNLFSQKDKIRAEIPSNVNGTIFFAIYPRSSFSHISHISINRICADEVIPYEEKNLMPFFSRFDKNTYLYSAPSDNFWGPFHTSSISQNEDYVSVTCPVSGSQSWPGIRINKTFNVGEIISIKLRYKSTAEINLFLQTDYRWIIPASEDWNYYELSDIEVLASFDRLQLSLNRTHLSADTTFYVSDFQVCVKKVGSIQDNIRDLQSRTRVLKSDVFAQKISPIRIHNNKAIKIDGTWNTSVSPFCVYQYLVSANNTYRFSGRMNGNYSSYFINWFDKDMNFISHQYQAVEGTENLYENVEIKAPSTARYLLMNVLKADVDYYSLNGLVCLDFMQSTYPNLIGKRISILGDSISTAYGNNAVQFTVLESDITNSRTLQGYPTYYDIGTTIGGVEVTSAMVGVLTSFTPVSGDAGKTIGKALNYNSSSYVPSDKTWWNVMAKALGAEILQNVSWSGASMSSHEGSNEIYKTSYAWHDAQIAKLAKRDEDGNQILPDVIIIYRGTNDMTHSPYSKITDFGANAEEIPDTDVITDGFGFKEAYALTIQKIRAAYPMAEIVCCTLNVFKRVTHDHFPTRNNENTLPEFNNAIREVANQMGCRVIEFDKDGITFENCYPTYISDSSSTPTHPNPTGHAKMAEKAVKDILK